MNKIPLTYNLLVNNMLGKDTAFLKGKVVYITLFLILLQGIVSSCEKFSVEDMLKTANPISSDSTLWYSLQGSWSVESIKFDLEAPFFTPEDPNYIEINGDTIRQFYLVNAPKTPVLAPNPADLEEIYKNIITFHAPDSLYMDFFPMECEYNTDSQSVELRAVDRAWIMTKARRSE